MSSTEDREADWPPPWAKTAGFLLGCGLMVWEAVGEHSQHIIVYGPAFALTGLPLARGLESVFTAISTLFKGGK